MGVNGGKRGKQTREGSEREGTGILALDDHVAHHLYTREINWQHQLRQAHVQVTQLTTQYLPAPTLHALYHTHVTENDQSGDRLNACG